MLDGFVKIGEYREPGAAPEYVEYIGRGKSRRRSCVYLLVSDGQLKYIGKTIQSFNRPLSYHKNEVMANQHNGIFEETSAGNVVEVFAYETNGVVVNVNGIDITVDVSEDYERSLIDQYNPPWNYGKE